MPEEVDVFAKRMRSYNWIIFPLRCVNFIGELAKLSEKLIWQYIVLWMTGTRRYVCVCVWAQHLTHSASNIHFTNMFRAAFSWLRASIMCFHVKFVNAAMRIWKYIYHIFRRMQYVRCLWIDYFTVASSCFIPFSVLLTQTPECANFFDFLSYSSSTTLVSAFSHGTRVDKIRNEAP